jgi:hypothetical protein
LQLHRRDARQYEIGVSAARISSVAVRGGRERQLNGKPGLSGAIS